MRGISWLAANRLAAQEGLCTVEWLSKMYIWSQFWMVQKTACFCEHGNEPSYTTQKNAWSAEQPQTCTIRLVKGRYWNVLGHDTISFSGRKPPHRRIQPPSSPYTEKFVVQSTFPSTVLKIRRPRCSWSSISMFVKLNIYVRKAQSRCSWSSMHGTSTFHERRFNILFLKISSAGIRIRGWQLCFPQGSCICAVQSGISQTLFFTNEGWILSSVMDSVNQCLHNDSKHAASTLQTPVT